MMKKLYKFSAIAAVLMSASLASCNHEEADIFDQNAAHRTEEARKMYKEILLDKGGKWQMEYFTTEEEHGYVYLFTFRNDGTVTISGNNEYITKLTNIDSNVPSYGSETSMWTILSDNGPVLSFNSYNTIFHLFATPEDIPGTERDEQGYGHSGDYEFDLMKFSNDTLYLEGKKNGAEIIMTRIAPEIDDEFLPNDDEPTAEQFKSLHKLIKKVTFDIEHFSYNTSISAFMIAVGELAQSKCRSKVILKDLVALISPFAPHIAEELWEALGVLDC